MGKAQKDTYDKLKQVECLNFEKRDWYFTLTDTRYCCYVTSRGKIIWKKRSGPYASIYAEKTFAFEELLKVVDKKVAVKLCHHLDIFV